MEVEKKKKSTRGIKEEHLMKIHASLDDDEVCGGAVLWGGMS